MAYIKQDKEAESYGGYSAEYPLRDPLLGRGTATPSAPPEQHNPVTQEPIPSYDSAVSRPSNLEFIDFLPDRIHIPSLNKPRFERFRYIYIYILFILV